jgi:hypothetical protein
MGPAFSRPSPLPFINLDFQGRSPETIKNIDDGNLFVAVHMHGAVLGRSSAVTISKPLYFFPLTNTSDCCSSYYDYTLPGSIHQTFVNIANGLPRAPFDDSLLNNKIYFDVVVDLAREKLVEDNLEDEPSRFDAKMTKKHYVQTSIHYHPGDSIYEMDLSVSADDADNIQKGTFILNFGIFILKEITLQPNRVNGLWRAKTFPVGTNLLLDPNFLQCLNNFVIRRGDAPFNLTLQNLSIRFYLSDLLLCFDKYFNPKRIYMPFVACHSKRETQGITTHRDTYAFIEEQKNRSEQYVLNGGLLGGRKKRKIRTLKKRKSYKKKN